MSENMERYRSRKERSGLRNEYFYPLFVFAVSSVGLMGYGVLYPTEPYSWAWLLGGMVCWIIGYGLYRCEEWARWIAAAMLAGTSLSGVWHLVTEGPSARTILKVALFAVFAIDLARPATGKRFQLGRGARDRAAEFNLS